MTVQVVKTATRYDRTIVITGAPRVAHMGHEIQPTAVRFWWSDQSPSPHSVEVLGRKVLKGGRVGAKLTTVTFLTDDDYHPHWSEPPEWLKELINTELP